MYRRERGPALKLPPGPGMPASQVATHQVARIHQAVIETVGERGWTGLRVRDLVKRAGLSSRAFYEHFDSKEDAFLRTYEMVARRASRNVVAAQAGLSDWRERVGSLVAVFTAGVAAEPNVARLTLVEAYAGDQVTLERARHSERVIEALVADALGRDPGGVVVPLRVVEGMMAGIAAVARRHLRDGVEADLPDLSDELAAWAACFPGKPAVELAELDLRSASLERHSPPADRMLGDRALLLAAVAKLAATDGYAELTVPRIRIAAGLSRRRFDSEFDGVEDCFVAALDQRAGDALALAAREQAAASSWAGGVYRAIASLCDTVAADPFLARVCLADDFAAGSSGARARARLGAALVEALAHSAHPDQHLADLPTEASVGAVWSLFHHHVARSVATSHSEVAATIAFMALAPKIGAAESLLPIRREQMSLA